MLIATVGVPTVVEAAVEAPETLASSQPVGAGPVSPGFAVDFVGVLWSGAEGNAAVRLRHDGIWGAWITLAHDGVETPGEQASALLAADSADAYQVRVPGGARNARAVAINTTDGAMVEVGREPRSRAGAATAVVTRAGWGADESLRYDATGREAWPSTYFPVQKLTVHHTATANGASDPAAAIRAIYRYHAVDRAFGDIGYQYLIDEAGRVYEGRWSGTDGDAGHDGAGNGVVGAHVGGFNSGNVGVALLGTLTNQGPTASARTALETLLADLAVRHRLDPSATGTYTNPVNGTTRSAPNISGHRDWEATDCPGGGLYSLLPSIRTAVSSRVSTTATPTTAAPTTATPTTATPTTAAPTTAAPTTAAPTTAAPTTAAPTTAAPTTAAPTTATPTTATPTTAALPTAHIGTLAGTAAASGTKSWRATATVTVHDDRELPLSGVQVTMTWPGGSGSCATDASGRCSVRTANLSTKTVSLEIRVTALIAAGYGYSAGANHDPAPTGSVAVARP